MKKGVLIVFMLFMSVFSLTVLSAEACDLQISMINQDPYPAIPGDYVKIVFQVDGIANPECGDVELELLEKYPITFDPEEEPRIKFTSGIYRKDYSSFLTAPYKVRVDGNALDGDNLIEVQYQQGSSQGYITQQFSLNIDDTRSDFEIYVKNYDYNTNIITFEVLNIGESDVEALTMEIPQQENIEVKGANRNVIGDLDSNEYTTADFEAVPKNGEIRVDLIYTDTINVRRTLEKSISFESSYFQNRKVDEKSTPIQIYIIIGVVVIGLVYYFYKKNKKKKEKERQRHQQNHKK